MSTVVFVQNFNVLFWLKTMVHKNIGNDIDIIIQNKKNDASSDTSKP